MKTKSVCGETVHEVDVNFAENQRGRHIFGGLVFSENNVFRPKNEPAPSRERLRWRVAGRIVSAL